MNSTRAKVAIFGIGILAIVAVYVGMSGGAGFGGTSKLLVLFLHETELDANLPMEQQAIPTSKIVVEYLDAHCYDGRNGWRYWDNDTDASNEDPVFQEILKQANEKYKDEDGPIVIISNGTSAGDAGPWAASPEAQVKALQKWGGP